MRIEKAPWDGWDGVVVGVGLVCERKGKGETQNHTFRRRGRYTVGAKHWKRILAYFEGHMTCY